MLRLLNAVLVMSLLASAFVIYSLEHKTRSAERRIAAIGRDIRDEREMIKLLNAEWSMLTRPQRLERLAKEELALVPSMPDQIVPPAALAARLPVAPITSDSTPAGSDPVRDLLQGLQ